MCNCTLPWKVYMYRLASRRNCDNGERSPSPRVLLAAFGSERNARKFTEAARHADTRNTMLLYNYSYLISYEKS